ncbi:MAG: GtrA family protein [Pacificimonas sp.]
MARVSTRRPLPALAARLMQATYIRYGLVSVGALGADLVSFQMLLMLAVTPGLAAGFGYSVGIVVHWLLSSRLVFETETHAQGSAARRRQKMLFVASAGLGLALTIGIVSIGTALGLDPRIAKLIAIAASFQSVWLVRRIYVFAR